jgi:hypothetical protein
MKKLRVSNKRIDEEYILYAVGLLSQIDPKKALGLTRKYLKRI